jgi:transcriptional regulator with XRE-family HTH domain
LKQDYPLHPQTLGEHIKKVRMDKGLLQKEVAEIMNVSEDTITYWENGRSHPQVHFYPAIISFLSYYPFAHETETIAGKLKQLRYCKGWSYAAAAKELGVDTATIKRYEKRKIIIKTKVGSHVPFLWSQLPEFIK